MSDDEYQYNLSAIPAFSGRMVLNNQIWDTKKNTAWSSLAGSTFKLTEIQAPSDETSDANNQLPVDAYQNYQDVPDTSRIMINKQSNTDYPSQLTLTGLKENTVYRLEEADQADGLINKTNSGTPAGFEKLSYIIRVGDNTDGTAPVTIMLEPTTVFQRNEVVEDIKASENAPTESDLSSATVSDKQKALDDLLTGLTINATIDANGNTKVAGMSATPNLFHMPKGIKVTVEKQAKNGGKKLSGAVFAITDSMSSSDASLIEDNDSDDLVSSFNQSHDLTKFGDTQNDGNTTYIYGSGTDAGLLHIGEDWYIQELEAPTGYERYKGSAGDATDHQVNGIRKFKVVLDGDPSKNKNGIMHLSTITNDPVLSAANQDGTRNTEIIMTDDPTQPNTMTLIFKDDQQPSLPASGGDGTLRFIIAGLGAILIGVFGLAHHREDGDLK